MTKTLESKVRDHNFMKMMGDLRFESGKYNTRLGDIIKGKASRDKVRFHLIIDILSFVCHPACEFAILHMYRISINIVIAI